jgi:hypothetical protein
MLSTQASSSEAHEDLSESEEEQSKPRRVIVLTATMSPEQIDSLAKWFADNNCVATPFYYSGVDPGSSGSWLVAVQDKKLSVTAISYALKQIGTIPQVVIELKGKVEWQHSMTEEFAKGLRAWLVKYWGLHIPGFGL